MLGDYMAGSLATFHLILQALLQKQQNTVIDSSMCHNMMYYGQPELMKNAKELDKPFAEANIKEEHLQDKENELKDVFILRPKL